MATPVTTTVTTPETAMAAESTPAEAAAAEAGIIVRNGKHGRALRRGEAS